jgi:DNA polymerase-3 subunit alpha
MSSAPLLDLIPIMRREQDGQIITQFDYPSCETLGLVKMDFLGLRNLTILDDALTNVRANVGLDVDLDALSKDPTDPATYELLGRGDTLGVFQFDGGPMRALLRQMKPDNFEDISAVGALYRPGPMGAGSHTAYALRKNGLQPVSYPHPELAEALEPILGTTYGLIVYQEQVMAIAQRLAATAWARRTCSARRWARRRRRSSTPSTSASRPACGSAASARSRSRRCGTSWCRSPTTRSTRPTRRRTGWSRTGPRT